MEANTMNQMQKSFDEYKNALDEANKTGEAKDSQITKLNSELKKKES